MSLGTLYGENHTRAIVAMGLVKVLNLNIKFGDRATDVDFRTNFPLAKVPTFIGSDGFVLSESIAIIIYFISLKGDEYKWLLGGENLQDYVSVLKWLSFGTSEFLLTASNAFRPILGRIPYNKQVVIENLAIVDVLNEIIETQLKKSKYLVGDSLTVADLFVASLYLRPFTVLFGEKWRDEHPIIMGWWNDVVSTEYLSWFFNDIKLIDVPLKHPE
ncbi:hypothetical protein CANARDRAFT_29295 [[Candida] arabinofermentans NRRL YB-2248]|uniref:GST C-terminal domain-containing protein n=1 Tax=[Candida] arabinofermentans NRRL YB-2248 TaxID=983967 RepID=A0A1E4SX86_9ASCO|nr:hypothetical protein CANARDRAFT_29295 [[Candida] arabinofermentans NRRL YB-2248]